MYTRLLLDPGMSQDTLKHGVPEHLMCPPVATRTHPSEIVTVHNLTREFVLHCDPKCPMGTRLSCFAVSD